MENKKIITGIDIGTTKVVAIIATDYAGNPCNWKELRHIASKYNIKLINDNCHAIGASYYNDKSYAVKYADIVRKELVKLDPENAEYFNSF